MFGDDPNPTVTTERFGFGAVFRRVQEGVGELAGEVRRSDKRDSKNPVVLGTVKEGKGNTTTTSGYGFYENIWMRCT